MPFMSDPVIKPPPPAPPKLDQFAFAAPEQPKPSPVVVVGGVLVLAFVAWKLL